MENKIRNYEEINFTQVCRGCKSYYETFKININKCYDENGKNNVLTKDLYGNFSYICQKCGLLNILNFDELCKKETVFFLRKRQKEMKKANQK